ncbi:DUF2158 domain-containing protein [Pseudomonas simiae]|uniref:YodC family protein n=1 Tax=Pseudomonas TaxID=286 RepID=UPI0012DE3EA0|nr:DUF2158 domain-containing protein [Pseudomonas simiae]
MSDFKVGDVVELSSGSPAMSVVEVESHSYRTDGRPRVICEWYEAGKFHRREFVPSVLKRTNKRREGPDGCRMI